MEQDVDRKQSILHGYDATGVVEPLGSQWFNRAISHYDLCLLLWTIFLPESGMNCHNIFLSKCDIRFIRYQISWMLNLGIFS